MASGMGNGEHLPESDSVEEDMGNTYGSLSRSNSSSRREPLSFMNDIDIDGPSAAVLLESDFIELDIRVVAATHTNESPTYGPCSATVIIPLDICYYELKQACLQALKRISEDRQWCKKWLRPKDEVVSILNIKCWNCSERLQEMYRAPRLDRECIEVFISGIVIWNATIDNHAQAQVWMDQVSAMQGQGRIVFWHNTYLPPRLPMELQPDPPAVQYEKKASAICWYWVELPVQDGGVS